MCLIITIILIFFFLFESHPMFIKSRLLLIDHLMSYTQEVTCLLVNPNEVQLTRYNLPLMFKGPGIPCILLIDNRLRKVSYSYNDLILDYYIDDRIYLIERNRFEMNMKIYSYQLLTGIRYRLMKDVLRYNFNHPSDLLTVNPEVMNLI